VRGHRVLAEPAIETAPGRKRTPQRAAAQATHVQLGDETADVVRLDGGEAAVAGQFADQAAEQFEIAP
jgi:hypothetical protein